MGDAIRVSGPINAAGLEMSIETGKLAGLAAGAGDHHHLARERQADRVALGRREGYPGLPLHPGDRLFGHDALPGTRVIMQRHRKIAETDPAWPYQFRRELVRVRRQLGRLHGYELELALP